MRIGSAIDVHSFENFRTSGEHLKLGLIEFPDLPKLEGHSDGDVCAHALADAMLLAAGLPDLGLQIGTDRPEWSNASGEAILGHIFELIKKEGLTVQNATLQIIGKRPKIASYAKKMGEKLAGLVGGDISVGATTTDGNIAELGDGQAVMVIATVLLN